LRPYLINFFARDCPVWPYVFYDCCYVLFNDPLRILPTLKATFGAQFTVKEGEWLLATLGDANLSPPEKKAALDARVQGWINMAEILARRADQPEPTGLFQGGEFQERRQGGGLTPDKQQRLQELRAKRDAGTIQ